MTERHYTETELDRFAQANASRSDHLQHEIDDHLKACASCREKLDVLQRFYEELEREKTKPIHPSVSQLAKSESSNVIRLVPFHPKVDPLAIGASNHIQVLAAQTLMDEKPSVVLRGTFASEGDNLLVRVIESQSDQTYRLHILSENSETSRYALIGIGGKGGYRFVSTNAQGVATIPSLSSVDWSSSTLVVLTPVAEFKLDDGLKPGSRRQSGGTEFECRLRGNEIVLSIRAAHTVRRIVAGFVDGSSTLKDAVFGDVVFHAEEASKTRVIRFFP